MADKEKLNRQQETFALEWIKSGNATLAALAAGYSEKTAASQGSRLLKNEKVLRYIRERMRAQDEERVASADEVLAWLTATMRGEVKDQFGLEAALSDRIKAATELMKRHTVAEQAAQKETKGGKRIKIEFMPMPEGEDIELEGLYGDIADPDA